MLSFIIHYKKKMLRAKNLQSSEPLSVLVRHRDNCDSVFLSEMNPKRSVMYSNGENQLRNQSTFEGFRTFRKRWNSRMKTFDETVAKSENRVAVNVANALLNIKDLACNQLIIIHQRKFIVLNQHWTNHSTIHHSTPIDATCNKALINVISPTRVQHCLAFCYIRRAIAVLCEYYIFGGLNEA